MLLNPKKERAILEWVNCLSLGDTIESLEELMDGKIFLHVINLMEIHSFPPPDNIKERYSIISKFLDDYYQTSTKSLIRYNECLKGKTFELAKIAVLLLSALVLVNINPSSQHIIIPLTSLDESIQNEIHECLETVLLNQDGMKLSAEFVTVLSHQSDSAELNQNESSCVYENRTPVLQNPLKRLQLRNRLPFTTASLSPLREFFDSPQLAAKAAVKEIGSLRSRLLSEQLRTTELETEVRKLHDDINEKGKEEQELRKVITELRQRHANSTSLEEYQVLVEQQKTKIEKLLSHIRELEVYKSNNSYLETDNQNLLKENEKLEESAKHINNLHKTNNQLSQENSSLLEELNKFQCLNINYENKISCLQQDLETARKELECLQQIYKEKIDFTKSSNSSSSSEGCDSGECLLTAFTEIELSELKSRTSELQSELEKEKEENKSIMLKNNELSKTINALTECVQRITNEKLQLEEELTSANRSLEEEKKILSKTIENMETINNQLKTDLQKIKEENSGLQYLVDCFNNAEEHLHQRIKCLSNEKDSIQQSYVQCSEQLENLRIQLNEAMESCEIWKRKSLHLEELKTDLQKIKEKNSSLQYLVDCLDNAEEHLHQRIKCLSNEKNSIQQSYVQCSEQLENLQIQLNETIESCDIWKQKSLHLEEKYNCAIKNHNAREENLLSEISETENKLKSLADEKESVILAAHASKVSMENIINEKEKNLKEQEEKYSALILSINEEKDTIYRDLSYTKEMLSQLENKKEILEKELNHKINNLVFEKDNLLSALKEVQSCFNKKVNEVEEKSSIIEVISHEKESLKECITTLEEIKKSHNIVIEELSLTRKSLEVKLDEECSKLKIANETHETEVSRYAEKILALESSQSCLEQEKKELTGRLKELDKKFQNLEKNAEEIMKVTELHRGNCSSLQTNFDKLTLKFSEVEKEKINLKEDMEVLRKEYQDQLEKSLADNQNLKRMITELSATLDLKGQEIVSCKHLLEEEKEKNKAVICALNQSLESAQSDIVNANTALAMAIAKHEKEVSYLKEEMNKGEKTMLEIKQELYMKELEVNKAETLQSKIELLENDHQKLIEKLEDVERRLRGCKEAKEMAEKEYYMCVEQKEKDKEDLRKQIDSLQREKQEQNKIHEEKITDLNNYTEMITKTSEETTNKLRNEINILKNENSNLSMERDNLKAKAREVDIFQAEIQTLNAQVKHLKEVNEEKEESFKSEKLLYAEKEKLVETEVETLKSDIFEKCHLISEKDKMIASVTTDIDRLKQEMHTIKQHKNELADALAEKEVACSTLTKDLQEVKTSKQNVESELLQLNEELCLFQQNNISLNQQIENLESTIVNKDNCIKNLSIENECLQKENKQLNETVEQLKIDMKNIKIHNESNKNASMDKLHANSISEHYNKSVQITNAAENLQVENFDELCSSSISVDDILERVECMVQSINDTNKTDLLLLVNELKDKLNLIVAKLNILQPIPTSYIQYERKGSEEHKDDVAKCTTEFLQKFCFNNNEKELERKLFSTSEELQFLNSELARKNEQLNTLKATHTNKIREMTEKSLNMEAALERKQKKIIGENLQLEEKLQNLEIKHEKLNLEKQVLQKDLNVKNREIEDLLSQISQEQKSRKKLVDLHQEEIQRLKTAERTLRNEYLQEVRNEITQLQSQVKESEQKNNEVQNKLRQERDILYKKYEGAKKLISSLQGERKETNEKLNEERGRYQEKRTQLSSAQTELEKKALEVKLLLTELQDEQKKLVPLQDKIRKQEFILQQEMKQKASLKAQLDLAERQIKEMKKQNEIGNIFDSNSCNLSASEYPLHDLERKPKHSRRTIGGKESAVDDVLNRKSMRMSTAFFLTEIKLSAKGSLDESGADPNLSTSMQYSDFNQNSMVSTPGSSIHRPVPVGTGYQFMCEDEDGEFMNHSYLGDLKAGRCVVDNKEFKRISELQRRNTLCLPHLQSSYPVETQMHGFANYTDDALKAGVAINDSSLRASDTNSKIPVKSKHRRRSSPSPKKRKHSHSNKQENRFGTTQQASFQKPSLPTPTKRNGLLSKPHSPRNGTYLQNENIPPTTPDTSRRSIFKTPSSLQKFFRRRPLRSSKETNTQKERHNSRRINM